MDKQRHSETSCSQDDSAKGTATKTEASDSRDCDTRTFCECRKKAKCDFGHLVRYVGFHKFLDIYIRWQTLTKVGM